MEIKNRNKKCLIIANGNPPSKIWIKYFIKAGYNFIICADGGANIAQRMGIVPNLIIGDLDSILSATLKKFKSAVKIIRYKRQNDTDVEKSVKYAVKNGFDEIVLCGATGDRLDHSFGNLGAVLKFNGDVSIYLHHGKSILYAIRGLNTFRTHEGEEISIYGIDAKTKFTSRGLRYPLRNVSLPFGVKESTSNVAKGKSVTINVTGGTGLIIRDLGTVKKHDLIFHA